MIISKIHTFIFHFFHQPYEKNMEERLRILLIHSHFLEKIRVLLLLLEKMLLIIFFVWRSSESGLNLFIQFQGVIVHKHILSVMKEMGRLIPFILELWVPLERFLIEISHSSLRSYHQIQKKGWYVEWMSVKIQEFSLYLIPGKRWGFFLVRTSRLK